MEWTSMNTADPSKFENVRHSTPKMYRPPPAASPNLTYIKTDFMIAMEKLAEIMAKLSIK